MATINRFEDIEAWKKARMLRKEVYALTRRKECLKDYAFNDQIKRSAISVMLNIAEGFARRSNNEFRQFLYIAHGSVAEVQSALYIALDEEYIAKDTFETLYALCDETSMRIAGFIKYLNSIPNKPSKPK